jgi:hypothetical protein
MNQAPAELFDLLFPSNCEVSLLFLLAWWLPGVYALISQGQSLTKSITPICVFHEDY